MYVIIRMNGAFIYSPPTAIHDDKKAAIEEAKRLAAKHLGEKYIIFRSKYEVQCTVNPVIVTEIEE